MFEIAVLLSSLLLPIQARPQDKAQFQEQTPVSLDAVIYFYRTKSSTDSMRNPTLYARGRRLVKLKKKRFFALSVPAGTHYFSWTDKPKKGEEAWVTVKPGQLVFFKVRWREIRPMSDVAATRDMRNLEAVETKNIYDPHVGSTAPAEMRVSLQRRMVDQVVDEDVSGSEREKVELGLESVKQDPARLGLTAGLEDPPLNLDQLLNLLEADISEEIIVDKIALSGCRCDTSAAAIITLKRAGASDELIRQIIADRKRAPRPLRKTLADTLTDNQPVPELPTAIATPDGRLRWDASGPGMDSIMRDGMMRLIIRAPDGLEVGASIRKYNWNWLHKNHAVTLNIENLADYRVTIEPMAVELIEVAKNKRVDQVSVQYLVSMHGSAPSAAWSEFFSLNQSATALEAMNTAQFLTKTALSTHTLSPGEERSGIVWFKQDGDELLVLIPLARISHQRNNNRSVYQQIFGFLSTGTARVL